MLTDPPPTDSPILDAFGGPVVGCYVDPDGVWRSASTKPRNTILYQGSDIIAQLLGGRSQYRIAGMYIEFVKSATTFSPITAARNSKTYYSDLLANNAANSDFLRVNLSNSPAFDATSSPNFVANRVTFYAQTLGTQGARLAAGGTGLTFADGDKVVGGALVAMPTANIADDLVFARFYYASGGQLPKISGSQVGISWPVQYL